MRVESVAIAELPVQMAGSNHRTDQSSACGTGSPVTILLKEKTAGHSEPQKANLGHAIMSDMETRASIIFGVCQNDPRRWSEFDAIYRPLLKAYLRKRGIKECDASEIVQDIFLKLVDKIRTYDRTKCRFRTWLFRVAQNAMIDSLRRRAALEKALRGWAENKLREFETNSVELEKEWDRLHRAKILKHALRSVRARVSPKAWSCFVGRLIEDRPAEEIAGELGMETPNAVYVSACRVLKKVRAVCEEFDEDLSDDLVSSLS
jgi:RNA polymerase sigma factor (sigma-70 family)